MLRRYIIITLTRNSSGTSFSVIPPQPLVKLARLLLTPLADGNTDGARASSQLALTISIASFQNHPHAFFLRWLAILKLSLFRHAVLMCRSGRWEWLQWRCCSRLRFHFRCLNAILYLVVQYFFKYFFTASRAIAQPFTNAVASFQSLFNRLTVTFCTLFVLFLEFTFHFFMPTFLSYSFHQLTRSAIIWPIELIFFCFPLWTVIWRLIIFCLWLDAGTSFLPIRSAVGSADAVRTQSDGSLLATIL